MTTPLLRLSHTLRWGLPLVFGLMGLWTGLNLWAAPRPASPTASWKFDFETDVDRDSLPDFWKLAPGQHDRLEPNGKLVPDNPHGGRMCFQITPDGADTIWEPVDAFRLDGRFTYTLTAWARTRDLILSGPGATSARIEARLLDPAGKPVQTLSSSSLTGTAVAWQQLSLQIPPATDGAPRDVRIALVVRGAGLAGKAWFDDVTLAPQPTIDLAFARPARFLTPADDATCRVDLGTLVETDYHLQLTAYGPDGWKCFEKSFPIKADAKCQGMVKVQLPLKTFGLYRVQARLTHDLAEVAREDARLGYLRAADDRDGKLRRFDVRLSGAYAGIDGVADALGMLGVGQALIDVWAPESQLGATQLDGTMARLRANNIQPVLVIAGVPPDAALAMLAGGVAADQKGLTPQRLLAADSKLWLKPMTALAATFGHRTGCWLIGSEPDMQMTIGEPALVRNAFAGKLAGLAPRWRIGLPVSTAQDGQVIRAECGMDFVLFMPPSEMSARDAGKAVANFKNEHAEVWVGVTTLDEAKAGRDAQLADLVERIALARAGGATRVVVGPTDAVVDANMDPHDVALVLATLARELDGLDYLGDLSPQPDVHVLIFSSGERATAVFWAEKSTGSWTGYLGAKAKHVDLWGNESAIADAKGNATLRYAKLPSLVTDIDAGKVQFPKPATGAEKQ